MTTLALSNFKSHCSKVISDMQHNHQSVVLTKHGEPIARVIPLNSKTRHKTLTKDKFFGMFKGRFEITGDIMAPLDEEWDAQK